MKNIDCHFNDERLQLLKQATILNFFDELSFQENESRNLELLDVLLEHLYNGDLDFCFQAKTLLGVDVEEKREIFKLVRKYMSLCFYAGNFEFWLDSVEGITLGGENGDFVCMKILDNYDFLLGVAKDGGEKSLDELQKLGKYGVFTNGVIVDILRNYFPTDDILREVIVEMSQTDGDYKDFTYEQKSIMLTYPKGVLYKLDEDRIKRIEGDELKSKLRNYFNLDSSEFDFMDLLTNISVRDFDDALFQIHFDEVNRKYKEYIK